MRLLERMILFDLIKVGVMAVFASSALLMIVGAMVEATQHGVDPVQVLYVMPYLMAPMLPYTIPSCLLFACTLVYGGMSGNNEITAIKAGGVHVLRVLWPAFLLGGALFCLGTYLVDRVIPYCNKTFTAVIFGDVQGTIYAYLRDKGAIADKNLPYELYVRNVQDEKLQQVIIKHRSSDDAYDMVAKAAEATLRVIPASNGQEAAVEVRLIDGVASTGMENNVHFRDKTVTMPIPPNLGASHEDRIETLSFHRLREESSKRNGQSLSVYEELNAVAALSVMSGDLPWFVERIEQNRFDADRHRRKSIELAAEVQLRLSQVAAAIPFALLGAPLSILFQRRDFLRTFFICFLPIITLYYPTMILSFNVVKESPTNMAHILWIPPILLAVISVPFMRRVIRY